MLRFINIFEFIHYLFDDEKQARIAAKIIQALLEAQSPRLSNIAEKMEGKLEACYKAIQLIADQDGPGGVFKTEPGGTFEATVCLSGIAAFGVTLAGDAQVPGQANTAIGQPEAGGERVAQGMGGIHERAGLAGWGGLGRVRQGNVGSQLVGIGS